MIDDTQKALDDSEPYKVSPKYQDAKTEWEMSLKDYISAGKSMVKAANKVKINTNDASVIDDANQAKSAMNSGQGT